jgi:hypothetical protein
MIKIDLSTLIARQLSSSRMRDALEDRQHIDIEEGMQLEEEDNQLRNTARIRLNKIRGRESADMSGVIRAQAFKSTYEVDSL